jgi:hypothetical protein
VPAWVKIFLFYVGDFGDCVLGMGLDMLRVSYINKGADDEQTHEHHGEASQQGTPT